MVNEQCESLSKRRQSAMTRPIAHQMYLPTRVVFTAGVADAGDHYIVASGEADLACRMPKALFA